MPDYLKKMIPTAVILILDLAMILLIPSQVKELTHDIVTTRFMPYFVTGLIALCAVADLIQIFLKEYKSGETGKKYFDKKGVMRVLGCMACLIAYLIAINTLGFVLSSLLLSIAVMLLMGNHSGKQIMLVSIVLTLTVYCMFKFCLNLRLPTGLFLF